MPQKTQTRQLWITCLRITATAAVIWMHLTGSVWEHTDLYPTTDVQYRFFAMGQWMMVWAVPIFLMVTGALFLQKQKELSIRVCLTRYCRRIVLALFIFGVPFAMLRLLVESDVRGFTMIPVAFRMVLSGESFDHLWYIYMLLGVYLVLPFIKLMTDHLSGRGLLILMGLIFLFEFIRPFITTLTGISIAFELPFFYMILYLLLGHFVRKYQKRTTGWLIAGAAGTVLTTALFAWAVLSDPYAARGFAFYNSPFTVLYAFFIFTLFRQALGGRTLGPAAMDRLWEFDRLCFGIYLIHPLYIQGAYRVAKLPPSHFHLYRLAAFTQWLVIFAASILTIWLLRKIPAVRKYIL